MPTTDDNQARFALLETDDGVEVGRCSNCREHVLAGLLDKDGRCEECAPDVVPASPVSSVTAPAPAPTFAAPPAGMSQLTLRPEGYYPGARVRSASEAVTAPVVPAPVRSTRDDLIAVSLPDDMTGAVSYWTLSGAVNIGGLSDALKSEGLDESFYPPVSGPAAALTKAVKEQASKTCSVKQHPEGGWCLVHQRTVDSDAGGKTLAFDVGVRVWLDENGVVSTSGDGCALIHETLATAYARTLGELSSYDASTWLVKVVSRKLAGVALRDTGGIYFVPRQSVATLRKLKSALASASSHSLYEIPAMKSAEALAAVLDAVRAESTKSIVDMENEITTREFSPRVVANRLHSCDEIATKVAGYEKLLGKKLGDVTERIAQLRIKLAAVTSRGALLEVD